MGLYTDLASTNPIPAAPRVGLDRSSGEQLLAKATQIDPVVVGSFAAANEVSVIPEQTDAGVGDTYTLTIELPVKKKTFTTAAIAYNAVAATIEAAIDTAATGVVSGWTNSDISVSMSGAAGLDDGTVTLTFDGASVVNTPALVSLTATGFNATGPITRSTPGRGDRKAAKALFDMNVIAGSLWNSGAAPSGLTRPDSNGQSRPRRQLILDLALQAAIEDGKDDIYNQVAALYPLY